ncbi:MAG: DUF2029 domain-containing protein [Acidobacteria bacterium]|nr:DUF2029 domain-containing protein [Acidobacteriota bacterium]
MFRVSAREARHHATILACVSAVLVVVLFAATPGRRDLFGYLKGADFVHFYALGAAALTRDADRVYDAERLHRLQVDLVPESADVWYPSVYPPQTSLIFAPLATLPYGLALLTWSLTTLSVYAWAVRAAWRRVRAALPDAVLVAMAAAGFPPFVNLLVTGQTTALVLGAFVLGWRALVASRPFLAGLAFGLLAVKPQFGVVLAFVLLLRGELVILAGALVSIAAQAALAAAVFGTGVFERYAHAFGDPSVVLSQLESHPAQVHSLRAVTSLLPAWMGWPAQIAVSAVAIGLAVRCWRRREPGASLGVVLLATLLVSPHALLYDATILVPAYVWLGAASDGSSAGGRVWPLLCYLTVLTFLLPTARFVKLQASVIVQSCALVIAATRCRRR